MRVIDKLRIAIVIHNIAKNDGQGRVSYELAKYLAAHGHEVHLYANRVDQDLLMLDNIIYHYIRVFIKKPHLVKGVIFLLIITWRLWKVDYDIVHLNGAVSLTSYDVNTCHFCHSAWAKIPRKKKGERGIKGIYYFLYTRFNVWLEKMVYSKKRGLVIAVSNKVKIELINETRVLKKKIRVIYNGVNTVEFSDQDRSGCRKFVIRKFNLEESDFLILFAGNIRTNIKGLGYLLKSLKNLNSNRVKLLVAGDNNKSPFVKEVEEDNLSEKVKFIGFRNDLDKIYKGAQAFVFPTIYDSFSAVILEAMASGLPVIVSKPSICGVSELITNMVNGILLINVTDSNEIANKIELISKNGDLRQRLGQKARKTAKKYSWYRMAEQYESLYYHLVSTKDRIVGESS